MSAELAETATAAEVVEPLNRQDAEKLDRRIRRLADASGKQLASLGDLLAQAQAGSIHEALEYPSFSDYVMDACAPLRTALKGVERRELVAYLNNKGMSERAIAEAVDVSKTTVHRDLEGGPNGPPEKVVPETTGRDKKTYPRRPPL